jgi:hypothetical protein
VVVPPPCVAPVIIGSGASATVGPVHTIDELWAALTSSGTPPCVHRNHSVGVRGGGRALRVLWSGGRCDSSTVTMSSAASASARDADLGPPPLLAPQNARSPARPGFERRRRFTRASVPVPPDVCSVGRLRVREGHRCGDKASSMYPRSCYQHGTPAPTLPRTSARREHGKPRDAIRVTWRMGRVRTTRWGGPLAWEASQRTGREYIVFVRATHRFARSRTKEEFSVH